MIHSRMAALLLGGCLLAFGAVEAAYAQEAGVDPTTRSIADSGTDDGHRFEMAFLAGGGPGTVKDPERTSTSLAMGIVRFAFNLPKVGGGRQGSTFGILVELVPYIAVNQEPQATGAGVNLLFRYMYAGEHWRPLITFGAGIVKTDENVPPGEVTKNYTPQGGIGLQYMFNPALGIDIEYRFHHLSNNNQTETNPGVDTQTVFFGLVWSF